MTALRDLLARSSQAVERRKHRAAQLASLGDSAKFIRRSNRNQRALVSPCASEPGRYRITRIDELGPIGHSVFNTAEEAMYEALLEGYCPIDEVDFAE